MKAIVEVATEIFHNHETKKATREVISPLPVISQYSANCVTFSVHLQKSVLLDGEQFVGVYHHYHSKKKPKPIITIDRYNSNTVKQHLAEVVSHLLCGRYICRSVLIWEVPSIWNNLPNYTQYEWQCQKMNSLGQVSRMNPSTDRHVIQSLSVYRRIRSVRNVALWPQERRKPGFLCNLRFLCLRKCEICAVLFPWVSNHKAFKCLVSPGARWWLMRYEFTLKSFPWLFLVWVLFALPGPDFHEICRKTISLKTNSFISAKLIPRGFFDENHVGTHRCSHTLISLENCYLHTLIAVPALSKEKL